MKRRQFTMLFAGGTFAARALLAEDNPQDILAQSAAAYRALHSYYFEGKTTSETTIRDRTSSRELGFVVAFEAPNTFRLEFQYPKAGNWIRASDGEFLVESRSLDKHAPVRQPVTERTMRILDSSPIFNFQRLSETAQGLILLPAESLEVDGVSIPCDVIQFAAHRRELRDTEQPGPSRVWIAKNSHLILREELRSSESTGKELSVARRVTTIGKFQINQALSPQMLSTLRAPHH